MHYPCYPQHMEHGLHLASFSKRWHSLTDSCGISWRPPRTFTPFLSEKTMAPPEALFRWAFKCWQPPFGCTKFHVPSSIHQATWQLVDPSWGTQFLEHRRNSAWQPEFQQDKSLPNSQDMFGCCKQSLLPLSSCHVSRGRARVGQGGPGGVQGLIPGAESLSRRDPSSEWGWVSRSFPRCRGLAHHLLWQSFHPGPAWPLCSWHLAQAQLIQGGTK